MKLPNKTLRKYLIEQSRMGIRTMKLNGTYYHGTVVLDDDIFDSFKIGHGEYDAIWVSDVEYIAEEFSEWKGGYDDNEVRVVYEVTIQTDRIANITYETSKKLTEKWGLYDFRETIPYLQNMGFNGWLTTGSIGYHQYDDIAIFNPEVIKINGVKIFINDDWTDYMSINDAQQLINDHWNVN